MSTGERAAERLRLLAVEKRRQAYRGRGDESGWASSTSGERRLLVGGQGDELRLVVETRDLEIHYALEGSCWRRRSFPVVRVGALRALGQPHVVLVGDEELEALAEEMQPLAFKASAARDWD